MDALDTITKLIQSPPGQLAAGGVLAGIIWKFFERVESILSENTKLEIAVWLLGRRKVAPMLQKWPDTFAKVFDRVFGTKHHSWKCFRRSCIASYGAMTICLFVGYLRSVDFHPALTYFIPSDGHEPTVIYAKDAVLWVVAAYSLFLNVLPDYASLLCNRVLLRGIARTSRNSLVALALLLSVIVSGACGTVAEDNGWWLISSSRIATGADVRFTEPHVMLSGLLRPFHHFQDSRSLLSLAWYYPAFFTSIWLWLYAGSGFLLKAARRLDIGFDWFNRHFDIEKKPLQSIGLVAGALVALVYWAAVIVSRVL